MDNTFENGFMCGLLMNSADKDNSKIKDPIFRDILEYGIPVASVKLSNHYKIIHTLYYDIKYPQLNYSRVSLQSPDSSACVVEEVCVKNESGTWIYPVGHSELYGHVSCPLILFAVFYKDDVPMVADIIGTYEGIQPTLKLETVYYYPAGAYAWEYDYVKEKVVWKSKEKILMKDKIEYLGDYTLAAEISNEYTNQSNTRLMVKGLLDADNNVVSKIYIHIPIHVIEYEATYPTYINEQGTEVRDNSKRPIISMSSESDITYDMYLNTSKHYVDSTNSKYTDLTFQELFDMNVDIAKDIRETLNDRECYTAKKAVWLN